ncbi:MAG: DEAD/DEAH box helicase [Gammaproteobacteria bacterium]|nr:DEAD/DEAH box helicase [Gammaproteobacteria bacterium]
MATDRPIFLRIVPDNKKKPLLPQRDNSTTIIFNEEDVEDSFSPEKLSLGINLLQNNNIRKCEASNYQKKHHMQRITGLVESRKRNRPYHVTLTALFDSSGEFGVDSELILDGKCTCADKIDCPHAAALALKAISIYRYRSAEHNGLDTYDMLLQTSKEMQPKKRTANPITQWSKALTVYKNVQTAPIKQDDEAVVYLLKLPFGNASGQKDGLMINLERSKALKRGGYGKSRDLTLDSDKARAIMTSEDKVILNHLYAAQDDLRLYKSEFHFMLKHCDALFEALLHSGKVYWENTANGPLSLGKTHILEPRWRMASTGEQTLSFYTAESDEPIQIALLPTQPVWYYDASTQQLGRVETALPAETLIWLSRLPPIPPAQVKTVKQQLRQLFPKTHGLPQLQIIDRTPIVKSIQPKVILRLYGENLARNSQELLSAFLMENTSRSQRSLFDNLLHMFGGHDEKDEQDDTTLALAECQFTYQGQTVSLAEADEKFEFFSEGKLHTIVRDREFERQCVKKLGEAGLEAAALQPNLIAANRALQFSFVINEDVEDEAVIAEQLSTLQLLADKEGWQIVLEPSFPARIIHEIDDWYTELEENSSGIDWFDMRLGVIVGGEKINILPLLLHHIKTQFQGLDPAAIKKLPDDTPCELRMDNGEYLKMPFPRIRNILLVLCEIFEEKPLDEEGALRLSRLKASLLPEIEKAVGATRLRWFGETKLKKFGEKLSNFKGIKAISPAKKFTATLRPYQQDGLNWLQFLREFELNGILADDMGLGKTIQALAHLSVDKQAKRLKAPSLLIAPTSLMTNWENEAMRFAPNLSILVLHGSKRHNDFENIDQVDVVLTTYPLVIRDKKILLQHHYQYLILDEAQQIKNPQAKVTQIILQMKAKHRLCLTGTPMENHLGELWSLFHFILPGFLGTKHQFGRRFRSPIEQQGDQICHQQLIQRIKPFMLRRRKDEVAQDLPAKTEIVRKIELGQDQRDLYESVRLAMEKKVRKAVDEKGLQRNQIIILDALLKLRQICCAPSLLKLAHAKKVKQSAKLDDLMAFLPELIEEGRRILLFSSFTSMLALIEERLKQLKIPYVKLTGQTKDRKTPVNTFQNKEVPLFLISLKAGGVGLNLTAADTVIHYDPWWNPAAEQQATDRAHRIGQKNPVFVYKMIVEGTVEECILDMQAKKREIIDSTLESSKQTKLSLTQKDLDNLFKPVAQEKF